MNQSHPSMTPPTRNHSYDIRDKYNQVTIHTWRERRYEPVFASTILATTISRRETASTLNYARRTGKEIRRV